ncbi:MAG: SdpI family protein [Bacteroidetes bacterium]|nr:SdpI family protein [Bacteroidota bacterium]MBS1974053.1 SdpI family protein [Bacteroidota bacterium]
MKSKLHLPELLIYFVAMLPLIYLGFIYPQLPTIVPTHFSIDGKPDGFSSKSSLWIWVPLLAGTSILLYLLMRFLPKIDPKKNAKYSTSAFHKIGAALVLFLCLLNFFVIHASQSAALSFPKAMPVLMGAFFAFLGNLMPTLKPNYFAGIRTPWTLENEETWRKTHHLAGRLWFAGGVVIVIESLLLPFAISFVAMMAIIFILVIVPVVFSYRYYKSLQKKAG